MEGPRRPGYYASVTCNRPAGPAGESSIPRVTFGEVHRYGPRQAKRTYVARVLLGLRLPDVESVWRGIAIPVSDSDAEFVSDMDVCMAQAQTEADRLNKLDPSARGIVT